MSPDDETTASATQLVDAVFTLPDGEKATAQAEVVAAVQGREGVRAVAVIEGRLEVCYDPLYVTEKEMEKLIAATGHPVTSAEVHRISPMAE